MVVALLVIRVLVEPQQQCGNLTTLFFLHNLITKLKIIIDMIENTTKFTNEFIDEYLRIGFGSMNKKDIDLFVLKFIVDEHVQKNKGELNYYDLARNLKITVSKLKGVIKELQARYYYPTYTTEEFKKRLLQVIKNQRIQFEEKHIIISEIDPMFSQMLDEYAYHLKFFTDTSFNSAIKKIRYEDLFLIVKHITTDDEFKKYIQSENFKNILEKLPEQMKKDLSDYKKDKSVNIKTFFAKLEEYIKNYGPLVTEVLFQVINKN